MTPSGRRSTITSGGPKVSFVLVILAPPARSPPLIRRIPVISTPRLESEAIRRNRGRSLGPSEAGAAARQSKLPSPAKQERLDFLALVLRIGTIQRVAAQKIKKFSPPSPAARRLARRAVDPANEKKYSTTSDFRQVIAQTFSRRETRRLVRRVQDLAL